MATPEGEETVAAPTSAEAVVAEVVKTAEGGEKEAPKPAEEPAKVEGTTTTEETSAEAATEAAEETPESAPVEPSMPAFKEESNLIADLKDSEKKALEDFKARIVKAIEDNEFKVPKKVVEAPKEPEVVETPKDAPAAETPAETAPAAETPAAETPAVEVAAKDVPAATETPAVPAPVVETPAAKPAVEAVKETPAAEPAVAAKEVIVEPAAETPAPEPVAETIVTEKEVATAPAEAVETEAKEVPAVEEAAAAAAEEAPVVEEEPEDLTPPEDVALWGVPLLHTKGDKRTDVILLKFLRARDFNVTAAFEQLKKTIIWRKTFKADSLLEEDFGTDLDEVAFNYGKDKEGHPVCYNVFGVFQNKELYSNTFGDATKITNFIRWRIQVLEKGIKLLNFSAEGPNALVQITDLKNSPGPSKKELKTATNQAVNLLQDNYPELVAKKVFINVPWYFSVLYSFVSPFLTARTKSKFVVAPPGKTTEALLKFIPAEHIAVGYGGLSKANDPDFIDAEAPATEVVIKAGEKTPIEIPVTEVGGTVVWDLTVVGYDVTYLAEYVPTAEDSYTTIIEKTKKLPSSTEEPVRKSFKISEPGKIVLTIENATRKKKIVLYRYTVKPAVTAEPVTPAVAAEPELAG